MHLVVSALLRGWLSHPFTNIRLVVHGRNVHSYYRSIAPDAQGPDLSTNYNHVEPKQKRIREFRFSEAPRDDRIRRSQEVSQSSRYISVTWRTGRVGNNQSSQVAPSDWIELIGKVEGKVEGKVRLN
jgi:hypothetical protein